MTCVPPSKMRFFWVGFLASLPKTQLLFFSSNSKVFTVHMVTL